MMSNKNKEKNGKNSAHRIILHILKAAGALLLVIVVLFAGLLAWLTATEYDPEDVTEISPEGTASQSIARRDSFTVMSWNMGYGALGDNADFFMDGGSGVITADAERLNSNLNGIMEEIRNVEPDVLFLQEIDENSKRSHHVNEIVRFSEELTGYESAFAYNYKVNYVPYPIPTLGKVASGIITYSKYPFADCKRYQLPISFSWPVRTANLKRALLVTRIPVEDSANELVLVNLHLEAYDSGEGKIAQTKQLAEFLNEEFRKGNYVIAGGDFNQIFSSENPNIYPQKEGMWQAGVIDITGITGVWHFLQDESVPSCRSLDQPYAGADHDNFQYYLIDGFIVSGNIKINSFSNEDLGFVCTDHNPVVMNITLK